MSTLFTKYSKILKTCIFGITLGIFGIINFSNGFNLSLSTDSNLDIANSVGVYGIYPINGTILISNNQVTGIIELSIDGYKYLRNGSIRGAGINAIPKLLQGTYEVICKDSPCYVKFDGLNAINVLDISCQEVNTGDIISGSCDTNYCVQNDLCPVPSNFSQLYINNIEHETAPIIKVTIPEEIQRDSNVDSGEFNLDIEGYGYDQDKMQNMVNTQYYKPTAEEMRGLVGKIADFLPLIAVALLIIWIRRVLKKVFKF